MDSNFITMISKKAILFACVAVREGSFCSEMSGLLRTAWFTYTSLGKRGILANRE